MSVFGLPKWFRDAPCKSLSSMFFSHRPSVQKQAVLICETCAFKESCAEWLQENPQEYGVWAARTPAEIRALTVS